MYRRQTRSFKPTCLIWNENIASDSFDLGTRLFVAAGDGIDGLTLTMSRNSKGIGYQTGVRECEFIGGY